jgi:hypothetical protein
MELISLKTVNSIAKWRGRLNALIASAAIVDITDSGFVRSLKLVAKVSRLAL